MAHRLCLVSLAALLALSPLAAGIATVETTADATIHAGVVDGTPEILTAAALRDAILIRFRISLVEHWAIQKAIVAFHLPEGVPAPVKIFVTEVRAAWSESSKLPPALPVGMAATTRVLQDGWCTFELPARVSRALAAGVAGSIAITEAEGKSLAIHSHRTVQFAPYLLVRGEGPLVRPAQPENR